MQSFKNKFIAALLLVLLALSLTGCHLKQEQPDMADDTTDPTFTLEEPEPEGTPSRVARLATLKANNWHPLTRFDASGRAVLALCYRGLFFLDSSEHMVLDLAESAVWNEAGTTLTIAIRQDVSYDDGKAVTAQDAAHSLIYYRAAKLKTYDETLTDADLAVELTVAEPEEVTLPTEEEPEIRFDEYGNIIEEDEEEKSERRKTGILRLPPQPFADVDRDGLDALMAIKKVELMDHRLFRIELEGLHPELIYHLDFPIVPADSLDKGNMYFPATGSFKIKQERENGELLLESRDQASQIREIEVYTFDDEDQMLRALSEDRVDLIYLTNEHYTAYERRRDLRSLPRSGRDYHLLVPGRQAGNLLTDPQMQQAFAELWRRHPEYAERALVGDTANYPLRSNSPLWPYLSRINLHKGQSAVKFTDYEELVELQILVPKDPKIVERVKYLRSMLYDQNIKLQLRVLDGVEYENALNYGDYDLAYVALELDYPFNPIAFWTALGRKRDDYKFLIAEQLEDTNVLAEFYREPLSLALRPEPGQDELMAAARALDNLASANLFYGLGFEPSGILLGPRVAERFTLLPRDPYFHLKEVTIWSSSSR